MINLRYHVYSLVAVFLALAIGVAAGSTVVQRSVVDNLRSTQGRIEQNLDELEAQNAELRDRTAALEDRTGLVTQQGPGAFLADALVDVPVMVIHSEGTPDDALGRVRDALNVAGAQAVADVQLRAASADPDALGAAAAELELGSDVTEPEQIQQAVGARLGRLIAAVATERASSPPTPLATDTTPSTDVSTTEVAATPAALELEDFLRRLDDLGLASLRGALGDDGLRTSGLELVVLGGQTDQFDPTPVLLPLLRTLAEEAPPLAVAADAVLDQPPAEGVERFGIVSAVRDDGRTRDSVSSVDHVGDFAGLGALVLSMADLEDGRVGHYGTDEGADTLFPARP